ncbi:MAG: phosphoribosylformylglycinamidine cyclo-ligase [Hyphomicrobiaceae bacterium]|jgi:phosphoribosylformylglycinamidine cyclo-ligase
MPRHSAGSALTTATCSPIRREVTRTQKLTYREAGVDIARADKLVARIGRLAASTHRPEVLSGVGPFASAVRLPKGMKQPVLLSSADGVGTKLAVARVMNRHDTVGIDLVAMNANDLITGGAEPLFFLDYLAVGSLASVDAAAVIEGIAEGCRQSAMSLVGGETAEMPGFYAPGEYDLAGFCVGVAERRAIIDCSKVRPGDAIVGLPSTGLHSNGFSLARKALGAGSKRRLDRVEPTLGCSLGEELLRPTSIYVRPVLAALAKFSIKGMAHITGGGIPGNLVRALPAGVGAVVDRNRFAKLPIFDLIQERGGISQTEMDKTFNCGVGYVMIVRPREAAALCSFLKRRRIGASVIGHTTAGRRKVTYRRGAAD